MSESYLLELTVNGQPLNKHVRAACTLVDFLREDLQLTGTHIGCDSVSCGACTVLVDNMPVKSCSILALQCAGRDVLTVEGLSTGQVDDLQKAFQEHFALQCGFCTPGFLMVGRAIVQQGAQLTKQELAERLRGNLCRCTGYTPILEAIYACLHQKEQV